MSEFREYAVIQFNRGVTVKLPVVIERKYYSEDEYTPELEFIARSLGGEFLYLEQAK